MFGISRPSVLRCIAHRFSESDRAVPAQRIAPGGEFARRRLELAAPLRCGSASMPLAPLTVESLHTARAYRKCGAHRCAGSGRRRRASVRATAAPNAWVHCSVSVSCHRTTRLISTVRLREVSRRWLYERVASTSSGSLVKYQSALDLPIPRSLTALLQHLQRLVGVEGHLRYCAGYCPLPKLAAFVSKMAARYPVTRNARERSYDRKRGLATVHMVV